MCIRDREIDLVIKYADILQVGARNMQNFSLLKELGRVNKPILLKRGMMNTIKEFLMSAEYVLSEGNSTLYFAREASALLKPQHEIPSI